MSLLMSMRAKNFSLSELLGTVFFSLCSIQMHTSAYAHVICYFFRKCHNQLKKCSSSNLRVELQFNQSGYLLLLLFF